MQDCGKGKLKLKHTFPAQLENNFPFLWRATLDTVFKQMVTSIQAKATLDSLLLKGTASKRLAAHQE